MPPLEKADSRRPLRIADNGASLIVFSGYSILTAAAILAVRGYDDAKALWSVAYCTLITMSAASAFVIGDRVAIGNCRLAGSPVLLMLAVLVVPFALAGLGLSAPGAVLTFVLLCAVLLRSALSQTSMLRHRFSFLALAVILTAYFFVTVNSMDYAWVLAPESALAGLLHKDILYHGAITSMLREYGIASTGLDGLQRTHYHILSHAWIGALTRTLEIDSISGYVFVKQLVFIPLMLFALTVLTRKLVGHRDGAVVRLAVIVVPMSILHLIGLAGMSYLVSESHAIGLTLLLLGVTLLVDFADAPAESTPSLTLLVGALLGLAATAGKVSAGLVFLAGFGYLILRRRRMSRWRYGAILLYVAALVWLLRAYLMPQAHLATSTFKPLDFFIYFPVYAIANLVPIVAAAPICILRWRRGIARPHQEMLLLILISSTVPALLLHIDGGSAYYFMNMGTWVAIAIIAAAIIDLTSERDVTRLTVAAAVCLAFAMGIDLVGRDSLGRLTAAQDNLRDTALSYSVTRPPADLKSNLRRGPLGRLAAAIEVYRQAGNTAVVYVEPELWSQLPNACPMQPLFIPAFVGLPVLAGLEPQAANCELGPHYSMPDYGTQAAPKSGLSDYDVCSKARSKGFHRVLRVETLDVARLVDCAGA